MEIAIVLLVVTAEATPIPPPSGALALRDPELEIVARVIEAGTTWKLLTESRVMLLPTVAVVLECC